MSSPRLVTKSPQCIEGFRPSQRPQNRDFNNTSNIRWGAHLDQNSVKGLWSNAEQNVQKLKVVFFWL